MTRYGSRLLGLLVVSIVLAVSACTNDTSTDTDQEVACAMLSDESLTELFGRTNLRSSGSLGTKESRQDAPVHCEVSDRDTGDSLLRVTVSDAKDAADAARQSDSVEKEAAALTGCERKDSLAGGGYACVDQDGLVAAATRDQRLIRLTVPGDVGSSLGTDRIEGLIDEINEHANATA